MSHAMALIDVNEFIDRHPVSRYQVLTIALCGCIAVLDGFDTQSIGFLAPAIAERFAIPLKSFAPVFSAGLFGLMIGALSFGPIADKVGRRWTVIVATLVFGVFTALTARVTSVEELVLFRFLTGLGLGGAMPNLVSLATEYSPKRLQPMIVAWLFAGIPIGAVFGGLLSSILLPLFGWQSVFVAGGLLPLLIVFALVIRLPESARFLIARNKDPIAVARIMQRLAPSARITLDDRFSSNAPRSKGIPIRELFTEGRAVGTLLLWIPYFMNLLIIYFVVSWLPSVLRQEGMPISAGVAAITSFSVGGALGCLVTGHLLKQLGASRVVLAEFGATICMIAALALSPTSLWTTLAITAALGFVVQGAQAGLNALVAGFYPTAIRSTGIGWALGIGRIGSIIGPLLGGLMLSLDWSLRTILLSGVAPALLAALAIAAGIWFNPKSQDGVGSQAGAVA
jgi:AAHS family 4-hydroxybenzoate transporter-like MFS transporter